ncbi:MULTISPECIES: hypothetical protein [unclassified Streptomyces]|uniref:Transposase n=1 Tax=Streptomyces sp. NBC_00060 TaxID=2975636 RepID=A0AAU2GSF1_9ACTN
MTSPYDGVQRVGMDLQRRRSVLARMAQDGQRVGKMVRFNNDPARLKREIAKAGSAPKVVRGQRRALVVLHHSILVSIWHMFTREIEYADLGGDYFLERAGKTRATCRLGSQLNRLGYQVNLQPVQVT